MTALERQFDGKNVVFTLTPPSLGPYSTIYLGGTDSAFSAYGSFWGLSEDVDHGNLNRSDNAFVFTESIPVWGPTAAAYALQLADYVGHETGHLLGWDHLLELGNDMSVLGDVAWKPYTHVEIAKD